MEKRFEPMTTAERRKTRLSAFFVVCIGAFILCVAYFILFEFMDSNTDEGFGVIKLGFMAFFGLITLFIVAVNLFDAIKAEKLIKTGTVTAKEVRTSRGHNAEGLSQYVVMLDDTECTVDAETFTRINVGETISLTTTRSGNTVLEFRTLDDPKATSDVAGRDVIEPMDDAARRRAWRRLATSLFARIILVGLFAVLPILVIVVAYFINPDLIVLPYFAKTYSIAQFAIPLVAALFLLKKPWQIARDIAAGQSLNQVRTIRDVVTSNRRLVGKTGSMSGWGDVTSFTYVDTVDGFHLCSPFPIPVVGNQVVISRLPRSRVLLGVYVLE